MFVQWLSTEIVIASHLVLVAAKMDKYDKYELMTQGLSDLVNSDVHE